MSNCHIILETYILLAFIPTLTWCSELPGPNKKNSTDFSGPNGWVPDAYPRLFYMSTIQLEGASQWAPSRILPVLCNWAHAASLLTADCACSETRRGLCHPSCARASCPQGLGHGELGRPDGWGALPEESSCRGIRSWVSSSVKCLLYPINRHSYPKGHWQSLSLWLWMMWWDICNANIFAALKIRMEIHLFFFLKSTECWVKLKHSFFLKTRSAGLNY